MNELHDAAKKCLNRGICFLQVVVREVVQPDKRLGAARRSRISRLSANVVDNSTLEDRPQPTAKRAVLILVLEILQRLGDGPKNILRDIFGLFTGELRTAAPVEDQRRVDLHHSLPRESVSRSEPAYQTLRRDGRLA